MNRAVIGWSVRVLWFVTLIAFLSERSEADGLVNNSGTSSEDSIVVSVINWDSAGCAPVSADSFWVTVVKSGSNEVVFVDSGDIDMVGVDSVAVAGSTVYYFHRSVADIDGAGPPGQYAGQFIAKNSGFDLYSASRFSFQVVGWELDEMGDSAAMAAALYDSLLGQSALVDSLYAVLDSLQNHDDWVSSFDASSHTVQLHSGEFGKMADTLNGRDSNLYAEGFWHKIANRADSGATVDIPDSASIAGWVWNTPQGNHVGGGTFGKYLDAEISGIGGGSGAYSCLMVAYDSTIQQVIPGTGVGIRNLDQTALLAVGRTNQYGEVDFNLDAGSYLAVATASGYIFEPYTTVVVSSVTVDTVFGDQFDPGAPSSPTLCRVYGHLYDVRGAPEEGATVTAGLPSGVVRFDGAIVSPAEVITSTDADGYFYLDLIPSASLQPENTLYELSIRRADGTILRQRLSVPQVTSWQLTW